MLEFSETGDDLICNLCESSERDVKHNCRETFAWSMTSQLTQFILGDTGVSSQASIDNVELNIKLRSTADRHNSVNGRSEQKSRLVKKRENKLDYNFSEKTNESRNISIAIYCVTKINTQIDTQVKFLKDWPGSCPTVNISWFIAKAYLANLYYTTQRDVSLTIQTCYNIINVFRPSYMNQQYAVTAGEYI